MQLLQGTAGHTFPQNCFLGLYHLRMHKLQIPGTCSCSCPMVFSAGTVVEHVNKYDVNL